MSSCRTEPYEKLPLKLDEARDGKTPKKIQGEALFIKSITSGATLTVKINKESADELDLNESGGLRYIQIAFEKLYFKHDAQVGKEVEFWVLRKGTVFAKGGDFLVTNIENIEVMQQSYTTTEKSTLLGEENTEVSETGEGGTPPYVLKKTLHIFLNDVRTVTSFAFEMKIITGGHAYLKITYIIDDGEETFLVEEVEESSGTYVWKYKDCVLTGHHLRIFVYLKRYGNPGTAYNRGFEVWGDYEKEAIQYVP